MSEVERIMQEYDERFYPDENALKDRILMLCNSLNAYEGYMIGIHSPNGRKYANALSKAQEILYEAMAEEKAANEELKVVYDYCTKKQEAIDNSLETVSDFLASQMLVAKSTTYYEIQQIIIENFGEQIEEQK